LYFMDLGSFGSKGEKKRVKQNTNKKKDIK
jgi:hypothetical protein